MTATTKPTRKSKLIQLVILAFLVALIIVLGFTPLGLIPLGFINVTILCVPVVIGTLYLGWKQGLILGFSFGLVSFISALMKPSALVSTLMAASPVLTAVMTFIPRLCIPLTAWVVYRWMQKKTEEQANRSASMVFGTLLATLLGLVAVLVFYFTGVLQIPKTGETAVYELSRNNSLLLMGCIVFFAALCGFLAAAFLSSRGFRNVVSQHAPAAVAAVCGSLTNTVLYLGMMLLFYVMCGIDTTAVLALIGGTALIAGLSEAAVAAILVPPILTAVQKIHIR